MTDSCESVRKFDVLVAIGYMLIFTVTDSLMLCYCLEAGSTALVRAI